MRTFVVILVATAIMAAGCANVGGPAAATAHPVSDTPSPTDDAAAQISIYSVIIRRLVTQDHTFGDGSSPFAHVYVVDGPIPDAGATRDEPTPFGPASSRFPPDVVTGIKGELKDLPPITFVADGNDVRRGAQGMQGVKNDGVIITLGPLARQDGGVNVATGLWCGGLCGQWLTYVLVEDDGRWRITGTTGSISVS